MSKNANYSSNVAIAMMMLCIFNEELNVDHNEEQGLVTLTNGADDCYCTITKEQHDNLFSQLGNIAKDMSEEAHGTLDEQEEELSKLAPAPMHITQETNDIDLG